MLKPNRPVEVLVGRAFAACFHPVVAWRRYSTKWRLVTVAAYTAASYVTCFGVLYALDWI